MTIRRMIENWTAFRKSGQVGDEYYDHKDYRWGMVIDLNSCIGCNACVTACYAENNLAVVGRERFGRGLGMHWMRIERYWHTGEKGEVKTRYPEQGAQYIPMMCQQCEHATCEPVCPVAATYHTPDGLNAQVYNRCIGSRYCSNNCPYKVRYFNFYSYYKNWPSPLEQQLNPDISVRDKGVMEKCTFCVQRLRRGKNEAKNEERLLRDGEVQTACQQSCPTQAISFGNLSDEKSKVSKLWQKHNMSFGHKENKKQPKNERGYRALEEINTEPSVMYLERVRDEDI
jgi:Fe-S-cluster-containing dehydrogenase component